MNRISRELIDIAREFNATEYDDFARLTMGFDKGTKQQRYDILQISVDKVKSRIGAADRAFQFINGLLTQLFVDFRENVPESCFFIRMIFKTLPNHSELKRYSPPGSSFRPCPILPLNCTLSVKSGKWQFPVCKVNLISR